MTVYSVENNIADKSFDVIFVIDCSGSMKNNDPNKLALSAAKLFIDLLSDSNSRAGYVFFADSAIPTRTLQKIYGNEDSLKTGIGSATYAGNTRMNLGLNKAYEFFETSPSDNGRLVILLSDGEPTVPKEVVDSEVEKFKLAGIPIYTIGLTKEADNEYMKKIADNTGAFYEHAQTANDLAGIFGKIYINLMNGDFINKGNYNLNNPVPVTIDAGKAEAYVILSSDNSPINIFAIKKPNGDFYSEKIFEYDNCAIIKIDEPDDGWWYISINGTANDSIKLDLLTVHMVSREINFIENGKIIKSLEIKNGKSLDSIDISDIKNPSKDDANLMGWYEDLEFNSLFDFSSPVYSNINLYAKWTPKVYTATFFMYDGNIITKEFNHGEIVEFPKIPNRRSYKFLNWYIGEKHPQSSESVMEMNSDELLVQGEVKAMSDNLHFYADWEYIKINLFLLIIFLILFCLTMAVIIFSLFYFPKIINEKAKIKINLIRNNERFTSGFAVIDNIFICLSVFLFFKSIASARIFDYSSINNFFKITFNLYFMICCCAVPALYNFYAAYIAPRKNSGKDRIKEYKNQFGISIILTIIFTFGVLFFTRSPINILIIFLINTIVFFGNFFISARAASKIAYKNYRRGGIK